MGNSAPALLVILTVLTGCFIDTDFDRPEVLSVTPSHNSTLVPGDTAVTVCFTRPMDTVKTNSEFSLSGDSGAIEGTFSWREDGKMFVFTPRVILAPAEKYTIRISSGAEDKKGNDLKEEYVSAFYISGETGTPAVLSCSPGANTLGNSPGTPVVITFSEPVDLNTIYGGISVSPSVQGRFTWSADGTVITFTPLYGFSYGVTYNVTVNETVTDASGNPLKDPESFSFTVGDDFVRPTVSVYQEPSVIPGFDESIINHGAEKDRRIVLSFSEIINTDNIRNAVSITPSAGYYLSIETAASATKVYINFTENLQSEETYTLRINSGIADLQGNTLAADLRYVFVTDGADSIAPVAETIGDLVPPLPPELPYWNRAGIQLLTLNAVHPLFYPDIVVSFSAVIDPCSLSVYIESAAGDGPAPSIVNIDWPDAPAVKFTNLRFGIYNIAAGNIYRIVIRGGKNGLRDQRGNFMKNDFEQLVRF